MAKDLADGGHVKVNSQRAKPAHKIKIGDIIEITGKAHIKVRVIKLPEGKSVPKPLRPEYYEVLLRESSTADYDI